MRSRLTRVILLDLKRIKLLRVLFLPQMPLNPLKIDKAVQRAGSH